MKKFVLITFAGIVLLGCNSGELDFDNIQVPDFAGVYAFPLGEARYTMRDLIESVGDEELNLEEDSTSLLTLFYRDTISYSAGDDLVQINDIVDGGTIPAPIFTGAADSTFTSSFSLPYEPQNGEELDSLFYNTGDLEVTVTSTTVGVLSYSLTFENTVNAASGIPTTLSGNISNGGTDTQSQSLENHVTRLTATSNDFTVTFRGTLTLAAGEATTGAEEIRFDFAYRNQTFQTIFGKFGQDTIQVSSQAINIEFFREMGEEGIFFGNPTMRFDFRNSFGVPIGADLSGLYGDDGNGGEQTFLTGDIVNNPPTIEGSDINNLGSIKESSFEVNNGNSSLVDLLATSPGRLVFDVGGFTNPNDNANVNENYLQPTSQIEAYVEMEIPMEIRLENLEQSGTLSLGGGLNIDKVDSVFMRIHTLNELPFSGILKLEVQDADSNSLYTVTDNLVIKAPFINVQGFVTDPNGVTSDIPFNEEGLDALANGSHVLFTVTLNTPISQTSRDIFVKLLADYSLEIRIGIGGKLNVDL